MRDSGRPLLVSGAVSRKVRREKRNRKSKRKETVKRCSLRLTKRGSFGKREGLDKSVDWGPRKILGDNFGKMNGRKGLNISKTIKTRASSRKRYRPPYRLTLKRSPWINSRLFRKDPLTLLKSRWGDSDKVEPGDEKFSDRATHMRRGRSKGGAYPVCVGQNTEKK